MDCFVELTEDEALKKGVEAHQAGQTQEAERLYRFVLNAQPNHPDANHNMGVLVVGVNKMQEALAYFKIALETNSSIGQYWLSYVNTLIKLGEIDDAKVALNQAKNIGAKGEAFDQIEQQLLEPIENGAKAQDSDPTSKELQTIINLYNKGQLEQALSHATAMLERYPNSAVLYNIAGASNAGLMQLAPALDNYKQALQIKPDYAEVYRNMGDVLKNSNDLKGAIDNYKQAIKITPGYAEAYNNMGVALNVKGDLEAAIDSYKQAIKITPGYAEAYNNMGAALKDKGDLDTAIDSYKQALKIKPDFAEAYNNIGVALQDMGDLNAAIDSYKQVLKIKPDYAEAHYNMGNTLNDKGDLEGAIDSYKHAIKIKPDYASAFNNMGNALKDKGDLDAALKNHEQALKIQPDFHEAHRNMGLALYGKGNFSGTIEAYKRALKIEPNNTEIWNDLQFPLQAMKLQTPNIKELLSRVNPKASSMHVQIAKSVLRFSLYQGGKNAENALNEVCNLLSKTDNRSIKNLEVTKKESPPQIIGPDNTVALVHFGRSGTGLLHSLIDGHPEVSTMPSIYFSEFFNDSTWEIIVAGGWNEMADRFIVTYKVLFDASARNPVESKSKQRIEHLGKKEGMANVGDQRDEVLRVDKALFREELQRLINFHDHLDAFTFFKLAHAAYDKALKDRNIKNLMFYHIHNPDNYAKLNFVQAAPNANWVMMVREPLQACESWVRSSFHDNEHLLISAKIVTMLFEIDSIIYHKQRSVGVRLEDLKEFPKTTIPALCDWMGIEESDNLYEMTAQGKKWWGDPASPDYAKDGMEPFGTASIKRKVGSVFTESDQFILHTLFYPFSVQFGYVEENLVQFKADLKTIRPMLDEMFGFEKIISERTQVDAEQFMKSGSYLYFRSSLIERWNVLAEFHTYPNMIEPLDVS